MKLTVVDGLLLARMILQLIEEAYKTQVDTIEIKDIGEKHRFALEEAQKALMQIDQP